MEFFREEYWSGLPFASPGDLLHPGIKPPLSCVAGRFFTNWATRKSKKPEAAGENCCHLVESFCNYNRTLGTYWHLCFSSLGSVNDSCPQDMTWGMNWKNKFQTQPAFKIPTNFFIWQVQDSKNGVSDYKVLLFPLPPIEIFERSKYTEMRKMAFNFMT